MGFVPFDNVIKVQLFMRQDNQRVENVLHFRQSFEPTIETMTTVAEQITGWWDLAIKPISPSNLELVGVGVTSLNGQTAPSIEYTENLPIAGESVHEAMPNNVTLAIRLLTVLRGRSFRGRIYHIGTTRNNVDGNTILVAFQQALEAAYALLINPGTFTDAELVVASRISGGVERPLGVATPVIGMSINRTLDSQRRRLPERGN